MSKRKVDESSVDVTDAPAAPASPATPRAPAVNTLSNYFALAAGPAAPPAAPTGPPNVYPNDERRNYEYVKCHRHTRPVLVSSCDPKGVLKAGCFHCIRSFLPIERFAPVESNNNGRKRPQFFAALADHETAYANRNLEAAREARARIKKLRSKRCPPCQETSGQLSPAEQACKDFYVELQKEACAQNDGCCNPACVERGPQAWCVLQGDHVHTANDPDETLRKVQKLSKYMWWAYNGGVEAMRAEVAKGINWPCRFCHMLEPTGSAAKKCKDPATMPDGKRSGTKEERVQYDAKRHAKIIFPKQQHIDWRKREEVGACALCARPVLAGQEHAFICDHNDPATKLIDDPIMGTKTLAGETGGVAGLVGNCANAATLDKIKDDVLDPEFDKCRLPCANCDHRQTNGYPQRV